jgi:hypothetical protein
MRQYQGMVLVRRAKVTTLAMLPASTYRIVVNFQGRKLPKLSRFEIDRATRESLLHSYFIRKSFLP